MKILLVSNFKPGRGGISVQVEYLEKYLRQDGHSVSIFSTKGSVFYRIKALFRLVSLAKGYDLIHAHGCSGTGMIPIIFSVIAGLYNHIKVIATYHGGEAESFFRKHTRLVKRVLMSTDANIVLSGFLGNIFDRYIIPYTVIPNIVELDSKIFRKRDAIKPEFISIRTLSQLYNIECIIRAFQLVKRQIPNAVLTIVGDGPSRNSLERLVEDQNIEDVTFVGSVPNNEIYEYLDKSDIMLSSPHIDNMPVSILEGFNAGLLVISSNVGGVPYMIKDGVNGLLFSDDRYEQLAEKMITAVGQQDDSKRMIENAHQCVESYSWNKVKDKLYKVYFS